MFFRCSLKLVPTSSPCTESMITRAYDSGLYSPSHKYTKYFGVRVNPRLYPFVHNMDYSVIFSQINHLPGGIYTQRPLYRLGEILVRTNIPLAWRVEIFKDR